MPAKKSPQGFTGEYCVFSSNTDENHVVTATLVNGWAVTIQIQKESVVKATERGLYINGLPITLGDTRILSIKPDLTRPFVPPSKTVLEDARPEAPLIPTKPNSAFFSSRSISMSFCYDAYIALEEDGAFRVRRRRPNGGLEIVSIFGRSVACPDGQLFVNGKRITDDHDPCILNIEPYKISASFKK